MEPFGVKVLAVVTGAVETNGQSYFKDWKLPENSLFKPIETIIGDRAGGNDGLSGWIGPNTLIRWPVKSLGALAVRSGVVQTPAGSRLGNLLCPSH